MEWQSVSVIHFIREFATASTAPMSRACGSSRVHAQRPAGRASADGGQGQRLELRDGRHGPRCQHVEALFVELNRVGFDGAVSIEWEDNDVEQHAGAKRALANCTGPICRPAS